MLGEVGEQRPGAGLGDPDDEQVGQAYDPPRGHVAPLRAARRTPRRLPAYRRSPCSQRRSLEAPTGSRPGLPPTQRSRSGARGAGHPPTSRLSRPGMSRRHSSPRGWSRSPVVKRLGFPATMWLGCRATVRASVNGAVPGTRTWVEDLLDRRAWVRRSPRSARRASASPRSGGAGPGQQAVRGPAAHGGRQPAGPMVRSVRRACTPCPAATSARPPAGRAPRGARRCPRPGTPAMTAVSAGAWGCGHHPCVRWSRPASGTPPRHLAHQGQGTSPARSSPSPARSTPGSLPRETSRLMLGGDEILDRFGAVSAAELRSRVVTTGAQTGTAIGGPPRSRRVGRRPRPAPTATQLPGAREAPRPRRRGWPNTVVPLRPAPTTDRAFSGTAWPPLHPPCFSALATRG